MDDKDFTVNISDKEFDLPFLKKIKEAFNNDKKNNGKNKQMNKLKNIFDHNKSDKNSKIDLLSSLKNYTDPIVPINHQLSEKLDFKDFEIQGFKDREPDEHWDWNTLTESLISHSSQYWKRYQQGSLTNYDIRKLKEQLKLITIAQNIFPPINNHDFKIIKDGEHFFQLNRQNLPYANILNFFKSSSSTISQSFLRFDKKPILNKKFHWFPRNEYSMYIILPRGAGNLTVCNECGILGRDKTGAQNIRDYHAIWYWLEWAEIWVDRFSIYPKKAPEQVKHAFSKIQEKLNSAKKYAFSDNNPEDTEAGIFQFNQFVEIYETISQTDSDSDRTVKIFNNRFSGVCEKLKETFNDISWSSDNKLLSSNTNNSADKKAKYREAINSALTEIKKISKKIDTKSKK